MRRFRVCLGLGTFLLWAASLPGADPAAGKNDKEQPAGDKADQGSRQSRTGLPSAAPVAQHFVDPKKDKRDDKANAEVGPPPITITAFGNKLLITSEDPLALQTVQELTRLLTQTAGGEGDFQVLKLKKASAAEAAKVLDEAFNGPKQTQQQQQPGGGGRGGGFGQFAAPGAAAPNNPREDRIRVVADPATNSLLVRASPLDMMTIRRLLDKAIDTGNTEGGMQTYRFALKKAVPSEVAGVLNNLFRESTNNNPLATGPTAFAAGFTGGQNQDIGPDGQPRPVTLSISADDATKTLWVYCTPLKYEEVKKVVDAEEQSATVKTPTFAFVPLKGIDPAEVQVAIDAIYGRTTTRTANTANTTGTAPLPLGGAGFIGGMGGGPPGGPPGGFGPGGFGGGGPPSGGLGGGPGMAPGGGGGNLPRRSDREERDLLNNGSWLALNARPSTIRGVTLRRPGSLLSRQPPP